MSLLKKVCQRFCPLRIILNVIVYMVVRVHMLFQFSIMLFVLMGLKLCC